MATQFCETKNTEKSVTVLVSQQTIFTNMYERNYMTLLKNVNIFHYAWERAMISPTLATS